MEHEYDEDQHKGQQISEDPHQVVLVWTLHVKSEEAESSGFHTVASK